jgi:N-acetylglucosamine kinase-like BadF-type ATPase
VTAVFLGIDAGGSHTTVLVGDAQARVLARADGPPSAMKPAGEKTSGAIIADAVRRAATQAHVALPAAAAMVGAAGAGREPEQNALAAVLVALGVAAHVRVRGDAEVALSAAFDGGPGILLNAGTGSSIFARDPGGRLHRSGGYGWQLDDEGGGYWIGRHALGLAAREHDGRGPTSTLLARLIGALGLLDFNDLVRWAATATPWQVAALAPHVLSAAREGERVAQDLVDQAAAELLSLTGAVARHFPGTDPIPVALMGGLLVGSSPLLAALRVKFGTDMPRARLSTGPVDAPLGALKLATTLP